MQFFFLQIFVWRDNNPETVLNRCLFRHWKALVNYVHNYEQFKLWGDFKWENIALHKNQVKKWHFKFIFFYFFFPPLLQISLCIAIVTPPVTGNHSIIIPFIKPPSSIWKPAKISSFHKSNRKVVSKLHCIDYYKCLFFSIINLSINSGMDKYFFFCTIIVLLFGYRVSFSLLTLPRGFYNKVPRTILVYLDLMMPQVPCNPLCTLAPPVWFPCPNSWR